MLAITSIIKCEIELILPFIYIMYIIYNPDVNACYYMASKPWITNPSVR